MVGFHCLGIETAVHDGPKGRIIFKKPSTLTACRSFKIGSTLSNNAYLLELWNSFSITVCKYSVKMLSMKYLYFENQQVLSSDTLTKLLTWEYNDPYFTKYSQSLLYDTAYFRYDIKCHFGSLLCIHVVKTYTADPGIVATRSIF